MIRNLKTYLKKVKELENLKNNFELRVESFKVKNFSFDIETRGGFIKDKFIHFQVDIYADHELFATCFFNNFEDLETNFYNRVIEIIDLHLSILLLKVKKFKTLQKILKQLKGDQHNV